LHLFIFSKANGHPVKFVVCRATRGVSYRDSTFLKNFAEAKSRGYRVGAYHYFVPSQPVDSQAMNYLSMSMILIKGDFRPIIDIEEGDSTNRKKDILLTDSLKKRFKFLLDTVAQKHRVVPVIYTSLNFYRNNFKEDTAFNKYPLWLAAYGDSKKDYFDDPDIKKALIHQFTDKVSIKGIKKKVDGNNIPLKVFDSLLLKK
jgi:lysozyme